MTEPVVRDPKNPNTAPPSIKTNTTPSRFREMMNKLLGRTDDDTLKH